MRTEACDQGKASARLPGRGDSTAQGVLETAEHAGNSPGATQLGAAEPTRVQAACFSGDTFKCILSRPVENRTLGHSKPVRQSCHLQQTFTFIPAPLGKRETKARSHSWTGARGTLPLHVRQLLVNLLQRPKSRPYKLLAPLGSVFTVRQVQPRSLSLTTRDGQ